MSNRSRTRRRRKPGGEGTGETGKRGGTSVPSRLFAFLASAALAAGATKTCTGVIPDSMCGKSHAAMGVQPDAKCVRECVKIGGGKVKYALVSDGKVLILSDQQTPEKFAAKKVKVTGELFEKTGILQVDKIEEVRWRQRRPSLSSRSYARPAPSRSAREARGAG